MSGNNVIAINRIYLCTSHFKTAWIHPSDFASLLQHICFQHPEIVKFLIFLKTIETKDGPNFFVTFFSTTKYKLL